MAALAALLLLTGCAAGAEQQADSPSTSSPAAADSSASASTAEAAEGTAAGSVSPEASAAAESAPEVSAAAESEPGPGESSPEPEADWLLAEHVYSHRGASGYEVEHTFASYDLAIEQGSHNIEQDVVTSRDGTLYVSHDDNAQRIAGVNRDYSDMTDEEISRLRTANGEGIHTMAEVFQRYGQDVTYLVELKFPQGQAEPFARLVEDCGMENNVIVQSFHPEALEEMERLLPEVPKLYLCRDQAGVDRAVDTDYADIVCVKGSLMTKKNCKKVHKKGKKFCVYWTEGEEVKKAIQMGVDCYFTNYTDRALALEREYREA
jgi:glycerophosphoryl diester phosphodiesterase